MLETHPCALAIAGCREACPTSHLMCIAHWRMVPMSLQRELWSAYRRWRSSISRACQRGPHGTQIIDAITELRKVQQMAIDAVMAKLENRDQLKQEGQSRIF